MSDLHTQTVSFGIGKKLSSLSNRWPCRVVVQTREYVSGEHALHGEKYTRLGNMSSDPVRSKQLLEYAALFTGDALSGDALSGNALSGDALSGDALSGDALSGDARNRLLPLTRKERTMWSALSVYVQTDICRWKAAHCREVQEDLFVSGTKTLVHLPKSGSHFCDGKVGVSGDIRVIDGNMLGYIWMDVRADRVALLEWAAERY